MSAHVDVMDTTLSFVASFCKDDHDCSICYVESSRALQQSVMTKDSIVSETYTWVLAIEWVGDPGLINYDNYIIKFSCSTAYDWIIDETSQFDITFVNHLH